MKIATDFLHAAFYFLEQDGSSVLVEFVKARG